MEVAYDYVIIGSGLAGGSAIEGIRQHDKEGSILLIGREKHFPYDRPPLTKKLWFGQKKIDEIFIYDQKFFVKNRVTVLLGKDVVGIDPNRKIITDTEEMAYRYGKLLLATGGIPRLLSIPGGTFDGVCYYRYLDDYLEMRDQAKEGKSAVIIGGGFIGSELAAALTVNKVDVTMVFPDQYLVSRVFPDYLGRAMQQRYQERGIKILSGEKPAAIARTGNTFLTATESGKKVESDFVIVGIGIEPELGLAERAGLLIENGIAVDEYLRTSNPDIFAAGDNAFFPYQSLGAKMRMEHWDNAINQGKWAGRNMAGANEPFTYMPYFFSDLFEFGYEAVGDVDSRLDTVADWRKENDTGVIYYHKDYTVRGIMLCNIWGKVDTAREMIRSQKKLSPEKLRGAIA
jgi:3-phenylpropionate/trans-cinnamate dioxygenase ferredoxin reductase component